MNIKNHAWFRGVNWERTLMKNIPPPWVPNVLHEMDTKYFDVEKEIRTENVTAPTAVQ